MKNFTETVQQRKSIEYLINNDVLFRAISYRMSTGTPHEAVWLAVECATILRDKIKNTAPQMDVSEQEKHEGYPLPKDDEERMHREQVRLNARMPT